jgi:hypothetical protein
MTKGGNSQKKFPPTKFLPSPHKIFTQSVQTRSTNSPEYIPPATPQNPKIVAQRVPRVHPHSQVLHPTEHVPQSRKLKQLDRFGDTCNPTDKNKEHEYQDSQFDSFSEISTKHINLNDIDDRSTPTENPWIKVTRNKILNDHSTNTKKETTKQRSVQYDINYFHQTFGHLNSQYLKTTAQYYNINLTGTMSPCIHCALANITKLPLSKSNITRSKQIGQRLFLDISKLSHSSIIGNKFWLLLVDDCSDYSWSIFLKNKNDQYDKILQFLSKMKQHNHPVSIIRCDNSGENLHLKQYLQQHGHLLSSSILRPQPLNKMGGLSGNSRFYIGLCGPYSNKRVFLNP